MTDIKWKNKYLEKNQKKVMFFMSCNSEFGFFIEDKTDSLYEFGKCITLTGDDYVRGIQEVTYFKERGMSVAMIKCGGESAAIQTKNGKIYVVGRNWKGELGLNDIKERRQPVPLKFFDDMKIISYSLGEYHAHYITSNNVVYGCGKGSSGNLGSGSKKSKFIPEKIHTFPEGEVIFDVKCGTDFSIFVAVSKKLFAVGHNQNGQLGIVTTSSNQYTPVEITFFTKLSSDVLKIACGCHHAIVLTEGGKMYSFGYNEDGELGLGRSESQKSPKEIKGTYNDIVSGGFHNFAVKTDKKLFSFGYNGYGQLSVNTKWNSFYPTKVLYGKEYSEIVLGCRQSYVITENEIWGCGAPDYGSMMATNYSKLSWLKFNLCLKKKVRTYNYRNHSVFRKKIYCNTKYVDIIIKIK